MRYTTGQITLTGTTSSATIANVRGKLKAIVIQTSASNTFWIRANLIGVSQDVYGSTGSYITVAADTVVYPRAKVVDNTNTSGAAGDNLWTDFLLDGSVSINVASGTTNDTFTVTLFVEA